MATKPTDLSLVKAAMDLDNVIAVLARTRQRITEGDLQGATGIMVIVQEIDGYILHDESEGLAEEAALAMCTAIGVRLAKGFDRDVE